MNGLSQTLGKGSLRQCDEVRAMMTIAFSSGEVFSVELHDSEEVSIIRVHSRQRIRIQDQGYKIESTSESNHEESAPAESNVFVEPSTQDKTLQSEEKDLKSIMEDMETCSDDSSWGFIHFHDTRDNVLTLGRILNVNEDKKTGNYIITDHHEKVITTIFLFVTNEICNETCTMELASIVHEFIISPQILFQQKDDAQIRRKHVEKACIDLFEFSIHKNKEYSMKVLEFIGQMFKISGINRECAIEVSRLSLEHSCDHFTTFFEACGGTEL